MAPKLCLQCGTVGQTKRIMKGSILTEFVLWMLFLLPGLIYSVWRYTSVVDGCAKCGSGSVIPLDSPFAQKALDVPESGPRLMGKPSPVPAVHDNHIVERHPSEIGEPWQTRLPDIQRKTQSSDAQLKQELERAINSWDAKYGTR
jgi:hypothetical protein